MRATLSFLREKARFASFALLFAAAVWPATASAAGATTVKYQGDYPVNFSVPLSCGLLTFSALTHYNQQFTYTPNGQLSFHFVSNTEGQATLNGTTYKWLNNDHEIDHLDISGTAGLPGFNADGTPNLNPYGGSLPNWLKDPSNFAHLDQISLLFYDRLVKQGAGNQLQNQLVISVNENGVNAFQTRFVSSDLCG